MMITASSALVLVDVQQAIDDPSWGTRNNPHAEQNMARLLAAFRATQALIIHVKHVSTEPESTYRPGQPGEQFKELVRPLASELVIEKSTNSAFIRTPLETTLRSRGVTRVVLAGVITNNSVESTARMSGNLGFDTLVVSDATATFGRFDFAGTWRSADEVHAMSLANLSGEYATIVTTAQVTGEKS